MWNCIRLILVWELTSWLQSLLQRKGILYIRFSHITARPLSLDVFFCASRAYMCATVTALDSIAL
jgi:hypothetical protein